MNTLLLGKAEEIDLLPPASWSWKTYSRPPAPLRNVAARVPGRMNWKT